MKTVLVVSFNFPPLAKVSVVRALKFCKFLPEFQWNPWVLTVDQRYYGKAIASELQPEMHALHVNRLSYFRVPAARTIMALLFPLLVLLFVVRNRRRIDAIYMVGSPFHPFIITPLLTKALRIPVVLDFRDSWSMNFGYDGQPKHTVRILKRIQHKFYFLIEKIALMYTSAATFATQILKTEYIEAHPIYSSKYHTIYNGYDEDDFKGVQPLSLTSGKTIIVAGQFSIYLGNQLEEIFKAVRDIPDLKLIYVGSEHETIRNTAQKLDMLEQMIIHSFKPYSYILRLLAGCDYGLLSNGLINGLGTKIFDYLALKKPCLCLVPKGSIITQLFEDMVGVLISEPPHSRKKIVHKLTKLMQKTSINTDEQLVKFTRRNSTKELSHILDTITPTQ